ncbi:MAG: tyrosine-type recombinase/integrase [Solirubrobacteraceae bacterium]
MARDPTGQITTTTLTDGTKAFQLRFSNKGRRERVTLHERRNCRCGCGGGWTEPTAAVELDNILAKVRAGVWGKRVVTPPPSTRRMPTFHEYASRWLQAKIDGTIGDRPIDANTEADYRWRLRKHLLPAFAKYRLDEIDAATCQAFKANKLKEAAELRAAIESGARIRDRSGRRARPLGPNSIRKLIACLAAILDEAVEDGFIERNPARGRRMRVKVPKPPRSFLEMDELVALTDGADAQDVQPVQVASAHVAGLGSTTAKVAALLAEGMRGNEIAAELGLAKSTVGWHIKRLGIKGSRDYVGRRAIVTTLGGAGLRVSELCDLKLGQIRLHDPNGSRLRIADAKTQAGIREVQVSPDLVDELVTHLDRLRRAGRPMGPEAYLFPNVHGGRMSRQRVSRIVSEASRLATERLVKRGMPPLPNTTPHSLRRTYVSIALLANNFDVLWVMGQVGHADSKMTTDVYAQLQQRVRREHGKAFDLLVRQARERLYGPDADVDEAPEIPPIGPRIRPRTRKKALEDVVDDWREEAETP